MEEAKLSGPSWIDVLALAAIIVVGAGVCHYTRIGVGGRNWDFNPHQSVVFKSVIFETLRFLNAATPTGLGLAVVAFARVLREPRANRRLLFRQPGVAACAAVVAALATGAANTAVYSVRYFEFHELWMADTFLGCILNSAARHVSVCVLATWAFLASGRLWTSGRNWVNWLGWGLGSLAVVNPVLWYLL